MRRRSNYRTYKTIVIAGLLALMLHAQLIFTDVLPSLWKFFSELNPPPKASQITEVSLASTSKALWEKNRAIVSTQDINQPNAASRSLNQKNPSKPQEDKKEEEDLRNRQVVDVAPTPDNTPPKNARFVSEYNTHVEKESVSRYRRPDYGVAQPRPTSAQGSQKPIKMSPEKGKDNELVVMQQKSGPKQAPDAGKGKQPIFEVPDIKKRDPLNLKLDLSLGTLSAYEGSEALKGNSNRLRLRHGSIDDTNNQEPGDEGRDAQTVAEFKRPFQNQLGMVQGAPANDHITDVPEGEETLLNTREFKYATFFNRVKRGVSEQWKPAEVHSRYDPYFNVYGVKDRYTLLQVELDSEGKLIDVTIASSSGLKFLDDEAIRAFQEASPFPNPPKGLIESAGIIHFSFGFYFEIGDQARFRVFRPSPY
jgi:TonB family C-terminal domain